MPEESLRPDQWHDLVFQRLLKAGWITDSKFHELKLGVTYSMTHTDAGKAKLMALHALLNDLGYVDGPFRQGELSALMEILGMWNTQQRQAGSR